MAGVVGAETGDFHIIPKQVGILGDLVVLSSEKLFLIIEAGAPGEIRADLEVFALAMARHVGRVDAFGGVGVMRATGGVNMMIAGPPAHGGRIDPALDLEGEFGDAVSDGGVADFGD